MAHDDEYIRPDDRYGWPHPPARPPYSGPSSRYSLLGPVLTVLVLCALVVGGIWAFRAYREHQSAEQSRFAQPRAVTPRGDLMELEKATIAIYKQAKPSVVHITSLALHQQVGEMNPQEVPEGTGSGFIWDDGGHVVTNYHVIKDADAAQVTLDDGSTYRATLVGGTAEKDMAVLRIDAPKSKLRPIAVGRSEDLQVGQMAFAIGNPFGLDHTLTTGVISALGRQITAVDRHTPIKGVIQTDAAINPGNSGGPLLDSAGRLIGMNTAIYSQSGSSAGIGFAIPVDEVNRVVPQLIKTGKVTRPGLGVQLATDQLASHFGVTGALIIRVIPGGPAQKAGLRPTQRDENGRIRLGDVIVAVDGKPVKKVNDFFDLLNDHQAGDTATLTIDRDGQRQDVKATLGSVD
jgi:S1-C subfamily serine protease